MNIFTDRSTGTLEQYDIGVAQKFPPRRFAQTRP
jgi:hypothetical protein